MTNVFVLSVKKQHLPAIDTQYTLRLPCTSAQYGVGGKPMYDNSLRQVNALLHTARTLLLEAAEGKRGTPRKRLKNIEGAVLAAIGAVACQGLTGDEIRAWRESQRPAERKTRQRAS
jgi:hypothetical protein